MANKEKLLASALKFVSKGQISKAIGEYQKLAEAFPKDVRNRQKLAELLSRDKRNNEAMAEYEAVAKYYTETGFYLKSIAVFKQMQKLEPSRVDIYHHLAELNEKQGLIGNALTEYRNLVSFYDKDKMHGEAIAVLEKMVVLDPGNLNFLAKIAECFMDSGRKEEAFEKFKEIISLLAERAEHVKIVKLYERFLDLCPEDGASRLPLANSLLKIGSSDKAVQILKNLLKHSPEDPDIIKCLTDAYVASQDFANARLTLKHLLKQKDGDLDLREYYVRICLDAGEGERARDRLEEWKDAFFQAERIPVLLGFFEELKELFPGDPAVAETLSALYGVAGETGRCEEPDVAVEVTSESAVTADAALVDRAIEDVETFNMVGEEAGFEVEVPPLDAGAPAKMQSAEKYAAVDLELGLDLDFETSAAQPEREVEPEPVVEEDVSAVDFNEDVEMEIDIDLDDLNDLELEFDEELLADEEASSVQLGRVDNEETTVAEKVAIQSGDNAPELELDFVSEPPGKAEGYEALNEELELSLEGDVELGLAGDVALEVETPAIPDAVRDEADQPETLEATEWAGLISEPKFHDDTELEVSAVAAGSTETVGDAAGIVADELLETLEAFEDPEVLKEIESLEPLQELELEELQELELEELQELELEELELVEEVEALADFEALQDVNEAETLIDIESGVDGTSSGKMSFVSSLNVEAELEEAEFYLQQGLYDDAVRVVQTLMEYRPELPELQAKLDEINQGRLTAESFSEAEDFVDIMSDILDDDLSAATDFLDSFGAAAMVDDELSQRLVSELDSADTESHYNLGIAYKEMGLYDDAVAEFEKAAKDPARNLDCTTLIGQCLLEAGETAAALDVFKSGLSQEGITEEGRMTLNFEVGMLHQLNGQLLDALEYFQLVAEKDLFFRDVSEIIKNLRRELGLDDDSNDDSGPQGNRDRVSYV